jgi:hypothetical protein
VSNQEPSYAPRAPSEQAFHVEGRKRRFQTLKDRLKIIPGARLAARWARRSRLEGAALTRLIRDQLTAAIRASAGRTHLGQAQVVVLEVPLPQSTTGKSVEADMIGSLTHVGPERTHELLSPTLPVSDQAVMLVGREALEPAKSAAGLLYLEGIACRPFDCVQAGVTAWVVEGFSHDVPQSAQVDRIHAVIDRLRTAGELSCAPGWDADEMCRTAIDGSGAVYCGLDHVTVADRLATMERIVDEQTRGDLHYGCEVAVRGGRFLYQTIPGIGAHGRRETSRRWGLISSMLKEAGESLDRRIVLDVGCNAGMMLAEALSDGALWGLGWDRPEVVRHARRLLFALGYTRFDLIGEELGHRSSLLNSVPQALRPALDECVVLFLAIRHHLGFIPDLARIPWRLMVYEGGESERTATLNRSLEDLHRICAFDVVAATDVRDGGSGVRPLALLVRRNLD